MTAAKSLIPAGPALQYEKPADASVSVIYGCIHFDTAGLV